MPEEARSNRGQSVPRPLWQLLVAEQTGRLQALTCEECEALLEFLGQLVMDEGYDARQILSPMRHCLEQWGECGLTNQRFCLLPSP